MEKKILNIKFNNEPVYGVNDKYMKTKNMIIMQILIFTIKKYQKKMHRVSVFHQ